MLKLNFPPYSLRLKNSENTLFVWDPVRKKFVVLTPEEWVRQHVIAWLLNDKGYPLSLLSVERQININGLIRRFDLVVFHPQGDILLAVECKAPEVRISQETFDQIARYNYVLNADWLMVSNGLQHYYCRMNNLQQGYQFARELPDYAQLNPLNR